MITLLISPEDFNDYADICTNVDPDRITPYVNIAQRKHLQPVLSKKLFDDFVAKYASSIVVSGTALSPSYAGLRKAIIPFLVYASYAEYLPYSNNVATPFGNVIKKSDYSEPTPADQLALMARNALNNAIVFKSDLIDYLDANFATDPLYKDQSKVSEETRVSSSTIMGIRK